VILYYGMHRMRHADDRIDRAGAYAEIAADAQLLVDARDA
jgi:hypothetical protein